VRRLTPSGKILLTALAVFLARYPVAWLLAALIPESLGTSGSYMQVILREMLTYLLPAILWMRHGHEPRKSTRWLLAVMVLLIGLAAQYVFSALNESWMTRTGFQSSTMPLPQSLTEGILGVLAMVIVPAVAEECFFRGALQGTLQREHHAVSALIAASCAFAFMHGSLAGLPAHLGFGLLLGICYAGTESLTLCMLLHGVYNAAAVWWSYTPVTASVRFLIPCAAALLIFAICLMRNIRRGGRKWPAGEILLMGILLACELVPYFL
jgi:membrane protease YdiL (CAAX protease family)